MINIFIYIYIYLYLLHAFATAVVQTRSAQARVRLLREGRGEWPQPSSSPGAPGALASGLAPERGASASAWSAGKLRKWSPARARRLLTSCCRPWGPWGSKGSAQALAVTAWKVNCHGHSGALSIRICGNTTFIERKKL